MSTLREKWVPIAGPKVGYEVSNLGRVRSTDRVVLASDGTSRRYQGLVLRVNPNPGGYPCVRLGRGYPILVHVAVATAFLGPCPSGMQVRHKDGDSTNNRAGNLIYGTPKQNQDDRKRHGTFICGSACHQAALDEKQVRRIKTLLRTGQFTHKEIGAQFSVSRAAVTAIANRRNWRHVED